MSWRELEGVKARTEAFEEEHPGGIMDDSNHWILYPDGAYREVSPMGLMCDGPRDPRERQQRIVHYYEVVLQRVTDEFYRLRAQLGAHANAILEGGLGIVPDEEIGRLKRLQAKVREAQASLEVAKNEQESLTPEHVKRAKAATARNLERTQGQLELIRSLQV